MLAEFFVPAANFVLAEFFVPAANLLLHVAEIFLLAENFVLT